MRSTESAGGASGVRAAPALAALLSIALVFPWQPVRAQAVYRCVEAGKPVSLQSTPCDRGAATTRVRAYMPEPSPSANDLAWKRYRTEREMAMRHQAQRMAPPVANATVLPVGGGACAQAKAERDAWERRVGLQRTIDGMRAWQEHVHRACR